MKQTPICVTVIFPFQPAMLFKPVSVAKTYILMIRKVGKSLYRQQEAMVL